MEKITVKKDELLAKLQENRADHRRIFEEALDGFRTQTITELETHIAAIRAGKRRDVYVQKIVPQDHTGDYDRAIAMTTMSIGDTVTLTERDFAQYVMDDWGWQGQFLSTAYGSQTATSKFSDRYTVG
jgi:hypothetical protein